MANSLVEDYKAKHRHRVNRLMHSIGIPLIGLSLPWFFFNWRWAVAIFVTGWIFQFIGHLVEGNQPAFFRNPIYLLVGPWWLARLAFDTLRLSKPSALK